MVVTVAGMLDRSVQIDGGERILMDRDWEDVREARNLYLKRSDRYYITDRWALFSTYQKGLLNSYRQTLRDLPQTYTESNEAWDNIPEPPDFAQDIITRD
jgi:beta-galactosidase GanA